MPQTELQRRIRQRDTLRKMIERAREEQDDARGARLVSTLEETEALITRLQAEPGTDESGERRRSRR